MNARVAINAKLPQELLREIFLELAPSRSFYKPNGPPFPLSHRTALTLSQVCQHWREVALDIPFLWTNMDLDDEDRLEAFITRSKRVPVCLTLTRRDRASLGYREKLFRDLQDRLRSLYLPPEIVQDLAKIGLHSPTLTVLVVFPQDIHNDHGFSLDSVELDISAPALEKLAVSNTRFLGFSHNHFPSLTHLYLARSLPEDTAIGTFLQFLRSVPLLKGLYLCEVFDTVTLPIPPAPPIILPFLSNITFVAWRFGIMTAVLSYLDLPATGVKLRVREGLVDDDDPEDMPLFPGSLVQKARYMEIAMRADRVYLLAGTQANKKEGGVSLDIRRWHSGWDFIPFIYSSTVRSSPLSLLTSCRLHLQVRTMTGIEMLQGLITSMPSLSALDISGLDDQQVSSLCALFSMDSPICCPLLLHLTLSLRPTRIHVSPLKGLMDICTMVGSRSLLGHRIDHLILRFPPRPSMDSYHLQSTELDRRSAEANTTITGHVNVFEMQGARYWLHGEQDVTGRTAANTGFTMGDFWNEDVDPNALDYGMPKPILSWISNNTCL